MAEIMVKATPVNAVANFVRKDLTPAQRQALLAKLTPEEARLFDGKLMATASIPLTLMDRFTTLAAAVKGEPVFDFARRAGNFGAEEGTRTVYKFIMSLMSPESVLRAAPMMWKRVYDSGSLKAEARDGHGEISIDDFPSSKALCGRITGWFEFIGKKSAVNSVCVHSSCRSRGDERCVWTFDW